MSVHWTNPQHSDHVTPGQFSKLGPNLLHRPYKGLHDKALPASEVSGHQAPSITCLYSPHVSRSLLSLCVLWFTVSLLTFIWLTCVTSLISQHRIPSKESCPRSGYNALQCYHILCASAYNAPYCLGITSFSYLPLSSHQEQYYLIKLSDLTAIMNITSQHTDI